MKKLHVGCGTVYLEGYINIDVPGEQTFLANNRADLVAHWITKEENYYSRHKDKNIDRIRAGIQQTETVCDEYGTFQSLTQKYREDVDEILSRQVFEHLSITEAKAALIECWHAMKSGGILRIDVPDIVETLRLYGETKDPFYVRHFLGPVHKGDWGRHCMAYQRQELINLVTSPSMFVNHPFVFVEEEPNIHSYPAFTLKFRKP